MPACTPEIPDAVFTVLSKDDTSPAPQHPAEPLQRLCPAQCMFRWPLRRHRSMCIKNFTHSANCLLSEPPKSLPRQSDATSSPFGLLSNELHQEDFDTWCPIEVVGKDAEEEEEEEDKEEEEEVEEAEEKKVELLHSPVTLLPDLMEFERYLNFYKQTMDLLIGNGIVSSQEVTLPIVSAAISHLWQILSEERKADLLQAWAQKHGGVAGTCQEPACAEGSMKDSGVDSQGASCSLVSTPEEILFEDAFDVASFLDKSEAPSTSSSSSVLAAYNPENPEEKFQLYMQIIEFFKGLCCVNTQFKQEPDLPVDDDLIMLRCMETFDDEDL
ncbi:stimulated by retinoic acid gene 8 protein homolog isoform X2 [Vicugna pacos]|uniref:Stimulated by retinoic acid gene 8 protein homolog isoform X2 n=1 Tax=Vicugna pacos TaxID=30538 RepID=A0ABM5DKR6_VICPA